MWQRRTQEGYVSPGLKGVTGTSDTPEQAAMNTMVRIWPGEKPHVIKHSRHSSHSVSHHLFLLSHSPPTLNTTYIVRFFSATATNHEADVPALF